MNLPFAEAPEQNKVVIFEAIKPYLHGEVLEIGSGTGQHAVFFASQNPELSWQTSDREANLPGIEAWIADSGLSNLPAPVALDVLNEWPETQFDVVYSANCFHIMDRTAVAKCVEGAAYCLKSGGTLLVYGPFNYEGKFTSPSNARFDALLRSRDAGSGIKDFEWLDSLAGKVNLRLVDDIAMPENNRTLIWQKRTL